MSNKLDIFKKPETYRFLVCFAALTAVFYYSIDYVNAGVYYDQAISFRPLCIALAIAVLSLLPVKTYLNFWCAAYTLVCYGTMHILYTKQLIHDDCEYQHIDVIRMGKLVALLWGYVVIAIIIDIIKNKGYRRFKNIQPVAGVLWALFAVLLIFFHTEYYYAWFMIIPLTAVYYVMLDEERRRLFFSALEMAGILSFFYVMYKSLRHRPYDTERYLSYFANTNTAGMYFAVVVALMYSRITLWWHRKKDKLRIVALIFYFVLFGILGSIVIYNYTRTTIMGMLISFAALFVLNFIQKEKAKSILGRLGLMILSTVLLVYPVFLAIRYIPAYINEFTYLAWEFDEPYRIKPGDPIDSPKYTSIESFLTLALGKWGIMVDFEEKDDQGAPAVEIDEERDVTNSRGDIWRAYLSKLDIKGHFPGDQFIYIGEDKDVIDFDPANYSYEELMYNENVQHMYHAHNSYLQMAYQYGILAGVIYVLLNGMCYLIAAIKLLKRKAVSKKGDRLTYNDYEKDRSLTFAMLMIGINMFGQLTECMVHPAYIICLMMYLSFGFVIAEGKSDKDNKDKPEEIQAKNKKSKKSK